MVVYLSDDFHFERRMCFDLNFYWFICLIIYECSNEVVVYLCNDYHFERRICFDMNFYWLMCSIIRTEWQYSTFMRASKQRDSMGQCRTTHMLCTVIVLSRMLGVTVCLPFSAHISMGMYVNWQMRILRDDVLWKQSSSARVQRRCHISAIKILQRKHCVSLIVPLVFFVASYIENIETLILCQRTY